MRIQWIQGNYAIAIIFMLLSWLLLFSQGFALDEPGCCDLFVPKDILHQHIFFPVTFLNLSFYLQSQCQHMAACFYSKSDIGKKMMGYVWLSEGRNSLAQMLCTVISWRCWWRIHCPKVSAAISFFYQKNSNHKRSPFNFNWQTNSVRDRGRIINWQTS